MLEARALTKQFEDGRFAVKNLNFKVQPGEVFGLMGPNGAGKTTTINLFLDFIRPTSGKALVDEVEVAREPRRAKRKLAFIAENVALYPTLTAVQNVEFFGSLGAGKEGVAREEVGNALRRVGLAEDQFHSRVGSFSKGMRQKVGIAVVLAHKPSAVLFDEPTSGLDPTAAEEFLSILQVLRESETAVLMASHDLLRVRRVCDRVGIMRDGQLCELLEGEMVRETDLEETYRRVMS